MKLIIAKRIKIIYNAKLNCKSKLQCKSGSDGKKTTKKICLKCRRPGLNSWMGKIPWRREWPPTPIFLPGEFHGSEEPGGLQSKKSQRVGHD